jgi:hypothetical protein
MAWAVMHTNKWVLKQNKNISGNHKLFGKKELIILKQDFDKPISFQMVDYMDAVNQKKES